jgi:competence protein ComEA
VSSIGRPQLAVYLAAAIAVALVGARYLRDEAGGSAAAQARPPGAAAGSRTGAPGGASAVRVRAAEDGPATVYVAGEVRHPGVYHLSASDRVQDAVRRAGGASGRADLVAVNLAAHVADGQQIVIPPRGTAGAAQGAVGAAAAGGGALAGAAASDAGDGAPINLNTAGPEQLDTLDGVGPTTARKIVEYRRQHGGFRSVDELDRIPGIGPKRLAALRGRVTA